MLDTFFSLAFIYNPHEYFFFLVCLRLYGKMDIFHFIYYRFVEEENAERGKREKKFEMMYYFGDTENI